MNPPSRRRSLIRFFFPTAEKELNVGFFAEESHVFDFNMRDNFFDIYSPVVSEVKQQEALDVFSDKILTLCQTLQICPVIRYQSEGAVG